MEPITDVFDDSGILRRVARWRATDASPPARHSKARHRSKPRASADPHPHGSRRRAHRRRARIEEPFRGPGGAAQVRLAGGFLAHPGIARPPSRGALNELPRRVESKRGAVAWGHAAI